MPTSAISSPPTAKGRETFDRIVSSATRLMFERGIARTSVEDVCNEANVGKSQLYHYFGDKAALLSAVIDAQTAAVLAATRKYLEEPESWDDWARWRDSIVSAQTACGFVGGCPLGSLAGEVADSDEPARRKLATAFDQWGDVLATGLRHMQTLQLLRSNVDVHQLATAILSALQGGLLLAKLHKSEEPLRRTLDSCFDYLEGAQ